MKVKIMISQPMRGKTNEEIKKERECVIKAIEASDGEYLDTVFDNVEEGTPLSYLSKSIDYLDAADVIYFMPGWEKSRGCRIEFECAKAYGKFIKCLTDEEFEIMKKFSQLTDSSDDGKKTIKIKLKSHFDKKLDEDDFNLDSDIEKFKKDLEEMLNDFTEKREG